MSAQTLKSRAAVAFAPNEPLRLGTIDVAPPKPGEVRVRIIATGVCHTDAFTLSGSDPEGIFPTVVGHEGGGVVESIGEGVTSLQVGSANSASRARPTSAKPSGQRRAKA